MLCSQRYGSARSRNAGFDVDGSCFPAAAASPHAFCTLLFCTFPARLHRGEGRPLPLSPRQPPGEERRLSTCFLVIYYTEIDEAGSLAVLTDGGVSAYPVVPGAPHTPGRQEPMVLSARARGT